MRIAVLTLLVFFTFTLSVSAQYVYVDPNTSKYYSIDCAESDAGKAQGFKTAAAAEKAGFKKGETCSARSTPKPPPLDFRAVPQKPQKAIENLSILYITNNISDFMGTSVRLKVRIEQDDCQVGYKKWYWTGEKCFRVRDDTKSAYVYMSKDSGTKLRDLLSLAPNAELTGFATIRIQQKYFDISDPWTDTPNYMYDWLSGELVKFEY